MNKKLPGIFSNKIDKKLNNNEEYYVSNRDYNKKELKVEDVKNKINEIFKSKDFIYRAFVTITLKDKEIDKKIIAIKDNCLLTIDGEYIKIDDILDIKIKD